MPGGRALWWFGSGDLVSGRQDRREEFDGIVKLCDELDVSAHPVMTTPFPGTELYTVSKILERMSRVSWRGFPMSHITSWIIQYPQGRAFHQYAREHELVKRTGVQGEARPGRLIALHPCRTTRTDPPDHLPCPLSLQMS